MSETPSETTVEGLLKQSTVRTEDGDPVFELPSGDRVRLLISVTEWTHDEPRRGEQVDMAVEVDADEFAWWMLYPHRSEVSTPNTPQDFPEITIAPKIEPADRDAREGRQQTPRKDEVVCEDCGESPTLVPLGSGEEYGVECGCERSDGVPVGSYVKPANFPGRWSAGTSEETGVSNG